jgi:hypothetical protein
MAITPKPSSAMSAFTLDGNDHLADLRNVEWGADVQTEMGHGIDSQETKACPVKVDSSLDFEMFLAGTGCPHGGTSLTALTVDAENLLAATSSFSVGIRIGNVPADGVADLKKSRAATTRTVTYTFDVKIAVAATTVGVMASILGATESTLSDLVMSVSLVFAGTTYTQECVVKSCKHKAIRDGIQTYTIVLESRAKATAPASGTGVIAVALIGDALLTVVSDSEAGQYGGTLLLESLSFGVQNGQLGSINGSGFFQGGVTHAASA